MTSDSARLDELERAIAAAKEEIRKLSEASAKLSEQARSARAENGSAGNGLGGMLFGAKYRAAMRRAAAVSNAAIARELAQSKATLAEGKRHWQERLRQLQADLKELKSRQRESEKDVRASRSKRASEARTSIDLLHKLKDAHDLGLLTDEEYELKRRQLAQRL